MARFTGKMMLKRYWVEPLYVDSADFVVSIYSGDKLDYIGRSV